jgi:putative YphP/YqiW family bacilliredoxin
MSPEEIVQPCRAELTYSGYSQLPTREDVDQPFTEVDKPHRSLVVIHPSCGCATGIARPGVLNTLTHSNTGERPDSRVTVFGVPDKKVTGRIRKLVIQYPPFSPSVACFGRDTCPGMAHRNQIEGTSTLQAAQLIIEVLQCNCISGEI